MRKIILYTMLVCLAGSVVSCKKFLDVTASNQIRSEDLLKNEAGFKDALIGAYIGMTNSANYGSYQTFIGMDLLAQQYRPLSNLSIYYQLQSYNYEHLATRATLDNIWKLYGIIAGVNNALAQIESVGLHPIHYKIIKGELLGLRAFLHFDLMRVHGHSNYAGRNELASFPAIPYITQYGKDLVPQKNYTETFRLLLADITAAQELLKEDPIYTAANRPANYYSEVNIDGFYSNRTSRFNYYAAKALEARVYTWMGGKDNLQKAAQAAREVINNSPAALVNSGNSTNNDRLFLAEHIFNLEVYDLEILSSILRGAESGADYNALYLDNTRFDELYELSDPEIGAVDKRQIAQYIQEGNGRSVVKLVSTPGQPANKLLPVIRISEMYYIEAEYEIENNLPNAVTLLNEVRTSRGILKPIAATATKEEVEAELTKEYRKDFVAEGQLFFYYKRKGFTSFPGLASTIQGEDKIYVIPFPQDEKDLGNRVQ